MFFTKLDHDLLLKKRICEVAAETGMSNSELQRMLGIDRRAFSECETEASIKTSWNLYKFCKLTGVSADYLLGLGYEKRPFRYGCN